MQLKLLFLFMGVCFITAFAVPSSVRASDSDAPVVIELFTSQSCSSCPPADRVLGELAKMPNVIALSCHVTYWNHLHWEDTLSREFCTDRQRGYAAVMETGRVYTPQAVINGKQHLVGSRKGEVLKAIEHARTNDPLKRVGVSQTDDGELVLDLPNMGSEGKYQVTLFVYSEEHQQKIPSGENRGRSVNYTHPVSDMTVLDVWTGKEKKMNLSVSNKNAHGISVIVQDGMTGEIVAAGDLKLETS